MKLYRYTANGEGIWAAGKRLLPTELVDEANKNRTWLSKPQLPEGTYRFFLTEKGKEQYEKSLLNTHRKYLMNIAREEVASSDIGPIIYKDEYQIVTQAK